MASFMSRRSAEPLACRAPAIGPPTRSCWPDAGPQQARCSSQVQRARQQRLRQTPLPDRTAILNRSLLRRLSQPAQTVVSAAIASEGRLLAVPARLECSSGGLVAKLLARVRHIKVSAQRATVPSGSLSSPAPREHGSPLGRSQSPRRHGSAVAPLRLPLLPSRSLLGCSERGRT